VLGVAWPSIRHTFDRPLSQVGFLLAGGTVGYLCASFFGGQATRLLGVGRLLVASSLLVSISLAGYWLSPAWPALIFFAMVGGLGAGAIDTGINTFAAARFSPRVVNWLHASWGVGATAGPLLMTAVLAAHLGWRVGYALLAAMLFTLSILFLSTLRLWQGDAPAAASDSHEPTAPLAEALRRPVVWLHVVLFFFYTGLESTAGQLLYTLFTESRGVSPTTAGVTVGAYWAALTVGRVVFGQLSASLGHLAVLRIGLGLAPVAALLIFWNPLPAVSFAGTVLLGFSLAPTFPTLISDTPRRVGRSIAPHAVGFQVAAAALGIAALPGFTALVARKTGLEAIGVCLIVGALVVLALHEIAVGLVEKRECRRSPPENAVPSIP
jgi:fucose permease